jgi:hypothetical protein
MKLPCRGAVWRATSLLLLFTLPARAALPGWRLNVNPDHIASSDTLAWSLLGVLGLTLGMVGACGWGIYRQFRRTTPEQRLLEELKESLRRSPAPAAPAAPGPVPPSWEKPADWWKNPPLD